MFEVKQIFIDGNPLLDEAGNPLNLSKKYKCVTDSYITEGGQGFEMLRNSVKKDVIKDGKPVKINEVLLNGLKDAAKDFEPGSEYPSFRIVE